MPYYFLYTVNKVDQEHPGRPTVFLPGWGFDERLADLFGFFADNNLIVPMGFVEPEKAVRGLASFLNQHSIEKVNVAGWSMGANIALDFTSRNEERVASLTLVSMRKQWPSVDVDSIRKGMQDDFSGFMSGFYRKCFLGYKKEYNDFANQLQNSYLKEADMTTLLAGLDYLEGFIFPDVPFGVDIHIVHGAKDVVAPVHERPQCAGVQETVFPNGGHAVLFDYLKR